MNNTIACSWSGGKDSCYALIQAIEQGYQMVALLNMMNENGKISRSHALPLQVLQAQANALGVPLYTQPATWQQYEEAYVQKLLTIKENHSISSVVFGDIDLEPHKAWEQKVCNAVGVNALLPLWQMDRKTLVQQMINDQMQTYIVSCNTHLGANFLGKCLTHDVVVELENAGVDVCGENGEYHTVVTNCSIFNQKINIAFGEKNIHKDYCFIQTSLV